MSADPLPPGHPSRPALETVRHWDPDLPDCRTCRPGPCCCGPICRHCDAFLGRYPDRPWPERCSICLFEHPTRYGRILPSGDPELDGQREAQLEAAVAWWTAKSHRSPPSMYWVIGRIARLVDRGQAKARPFEVFALAAADLNSDRALGARLACSAFCDELGPDLELLIVSWCASQKGAPHPAPRTW